MVSMVIHTHQKYLFYFFTNLLTRTELADIQSLLAIKSKEKSI